MPKRSHTSSLLSEESDDSFSSSPSISTRKQRSHYRNDHFSMQMKCSVIFERLKNYRDDTGNLLFDMFWMAPLRRLSPEYYAIVQRPMDFAMMQDRIKDEEYANLDDIQRDMELIFANAKLFYGEESEEAAAAEQLRRVFLDERVRVENRGLAEETCGNAELGPETSTMKLRPIRVNKRPIVDDSTSSQGSGCESNHSDGSCGTPPLQQGPASSTSAPRPNVTPLHSYFAVVAKHRTSEGRELANTFALLPSRSMYPNYYQIIREPIDLHLIAQKILAGAYNSVTDMHSDLQLMAKNARVFNVPHSEIYEDALTLARFARKKKASFENDGKGRTGARRLLPDAMEIVERFASLTPAVDTSSDSTKVPDHVSPVNKCEYNVRDPRYLQRRLFDSISQLSISEAFMNLPSEKLYPQYYREIQSPLSLGIIRNRIHSNSYRCMEELVNDFDILFTNAQVFNCEESVIYKHAVKLQQMVHSHKRQLTNESADASVPHQTSLLCSPTTVSTPTSQSSFGASLQSSNVTSLQSFTMSPQCNNAMSAMSVVPIAPIASIPSSTPPPTSNHTHQQNPPLQPKTQISTTPTHVDYLLRRLNDIYAFIYHFQENGRFLRDIFMTLPPKEIYPDYYSIITEPIDLTMIRTKIDNHQYKTQQSLLNDLRRMFNNAKVYNQDTSQVFKDAETLDVAVRRRVKHYGPMSAAPSSRPVPKSSPTSSAATKVKTGIATELFGPNAHSAPEVLRAKIEKRRMHELYLTVKEYREPRSGRLLSLPFMRLPSRQELPQYYEVIARPVELLGIGQKLSQGKYAAVANLMADLVLMFENACHYNAPESVIYKDALTLHRICLEKKAILMVEDDVLTAEGVAVTPPVVDVALCVQDMLTRLFCRVHNYEDEEGRCLSDSFADIVPNRSSSSSTAPVVADNQNVTSLDQVKRRLGAGCYRRLDRFQEDVFAVLHYMREKSSLGSQVYEDACELQRVFIRLRDELTDHGKRLTSPALLFTETTLQSQLSEDAAQKRGEMSNNHLETGWNCSSDGRSGHHGDADEGIGGDEGFDEIPVQPPLGGLRSIQHRGRTYHVHDFVYVAAMHPSARRNHIACITAISTPSSESTSLTNGRVGSPSTVASSSSSVMVTVNWFYRVEETFHMPTRKFLPNEVFKTGAVEQVTLESIVGPCHVMWVKEFIKQKPKGLSEEDVYVCESRYSLKQRTFKKMKVWNEAQSPAVELEDRPVPITLQRESSVFVAAGNSTRSSSNSTSVSNGKMGLLEVVKESVVLQDTTQRGNADGTAFQQVVFPSGFWVKLGDFVYLPLQDGKRRQIVRVERVWHNHMQDLYYFSGPSFLRPNEVSFSSPAPSGFLEKEVFLIQEDASSSAKSSQQHILASALGKCFVLSVKDYSTFRPTEYAESDIYVCESQYHTENKSITPLKEGFKTFQLSEKVCQDEVYFFTKPIPLRKSVSRDGRISAASRPSESQKWANVRQPVLETTSSAGALVTTVTATPTTSSTPKSKKRRQPPSAYTIYAAEQHKKLKPQRPDAHFGDISREVGQMWRCLPDAEKKVFEMKAQEIRARLEEESPSKLMSPASSPSPAPDATAPAPPLPPPPEIRPSLKVMGVCSGAGSNIQSSSSSGGPTVVLVAASPTVPPAPPGCSYVMLPTSQDTGGSGLLVSSYSHAAPVTYLVQSSQAPVRPHTGGVSSTAAPTWSNVIPVQRPSLILQPLAPASVNPSPQMSLPLPTPVSIQSAPASHNGVSLTTIGKTVISSAPTASATGPQVATSSTPPLSQATKNETPPSTPVFVSVPPKPTKLLHSIVYSRYIDALRKEDSRLSNWPKQLSASKTSHTTSATSNSHLKTSSTTGISSEDIAEQFLLPNSWLPQHSSTVDAVWALRDHLLRDALNLRTKVLGWR